jgi:glutathione S-transferase
MDGEFYSESRSILRLLGKILKLYPEDPIDAWRVDSTIDRNDDLQDDFWKVIFELPTPEEKEKKMEKLENELLPAYFEEMQKRLLKNGNKKFMCGDSMNIGDIHNAYIALVYILNDNKNVKNDEWGNWAIDPVMTKRFRKALKPFKELEKYYEGLKEMFADYLAIRPETPY